MMMPTFYVITFRYHGEPGSGIVGVYADQTISAYVLSILEKHGDLCKVFEVHEVPCLDGIIGLTAKAAA